MANGNSVTCGVIVKGKVIDRKDEDIGQKMSRKLRRKQVMADRLKPNLRLPPESCDKCAAFNWSSPRG